MAEPKNAPPESSRLGAAVAHRPSQTVDYRQLGRPGLNIASGYVMEEKLRALQGQRGMETYKEMELDSTVGTSLNLIERAGRQAPRIITPASQHPNDLEAAAFLESCMDDMDLSWSDVLADMVRGVPQYGFSLHALNYKRRAGDAPEGHLKSQHRDGRIGWRSITGLAQETITRWLLNEAGDNEFVAVEQNAPPFYGFEEIPMDRLLHIRQSTHKNNPLGISALRCVFKDWYYKTKLETYLAIGAERSVAGLPVLRVPPEVLAAATPEDAAMLDVCKRIATGIRVDEDGGIVYPMARDANGQLLFDIELMSTNSNQIGELLKAISLLDYRIAAALSTEFIKLGESNGATGSYAMHSSKTDQYAQMLNSLLKCIADAFNRFAIKRLFALNDFQIDDLPVLSFGELGTTDLKDVGAFLQSAAAAGFVLAPNQAAEDRIMELAGLPPLSREDNGVPAMPPMGDPRPEEVTEVHDGDVHPDEGEAKMVDQLPTGNVRNPAMGQPAVVR